MKSEKNLPKNPSKKESLERLQNQMEQAKLDGNPKLANQIKAIIDRLKPYERALKK